jgi:hypothetical protein
LTDAPAILPDEAFETDLLEVRLLDDGPGGPHRLRFTLGRSLDDPALIFVRPVAGVLMRVGVPPIGERVEMPEPIPILHYIR